mgnify:CR=1 FL=1
MTFILQQTEIILQKPHIFVQLTVPKQIEKENSFAWTIKRLIGQALRDSALKEYIIVVKSWCRVADKKTTV